MIPGDKRRMNVTLVPAMVAQLDRLARYWGVHRSTVISATINAVLLTVEDLRSTTSTSPDTRARQPSRTSPQPSSHFHWAKHSAPICNTPGRENPNRSVCMDICLISL